MSSPVINQPLSKSKLFTDVLGYSPHAGQRDLHQNRSRFKVIRCGRRWGKTFFGGHEGTTRVLTPSPFAGGPSMGWVVGPNYTDAEKEFRIIYDDMRRLGVDRDCIRFVNNSDSGSMHIKTSWGAEVIGKSAQHPDKLVGEGLDWVLMVEAGRHKRSTWGQYIRPTLSDKRGEAIFSGVPEGKSENSLLYALYERGQSERFPSWMSFKRPSWTNDIVFPGGREDPEILEAEDDLTKDEFDRQYGAEFTDKTGVVMKEYDDDIHLGDFDYRPDWATYMAVDYGFTNPFVVLIIQVGPFGDIRVIREFRRTQLDTPEVCADLMQEYPGLVRVASMLYPDPAEPDDTRTMQRLLRIPANKNTGGPLRIRLSHIRRSLKVKNVHLPLGDIERRPTLMIDRTHCKELAWEMREGYKWPEHKSQQRSDSENPLDKDNHGIEALGRFFRGHYGKSVIGGGSFVALAEMND
ncbi:MAG: hypothetical protein ABW022_11010 [Actinoplanes sp.]